MRIIADRIYAVERCFSVREGLTKKDDFLQGKWADEPTCGGQFDGCFLDKEKYKKMLEDYYEIRGWDRERGIPTEERLKSLEIEDVAKDLKKYLQYIKW
jgi:aldehyde:ferredoxin oxidoreductase